MSTLHLRINCGSDHDWIDPEGNRWAAYVFVDADETVLRKLASRDSGDRVCVGSSAIKTQHNKAKSF